MPERRSAPHSLRVVGALALRVNRWSDRLGLQTLDLLGGLGLREVGRDLLAGLSREGVEVAALRRGHRLVTGDPVGGILLGGVLTLAHGTQGLFFTEESLMGRGYARSVTPGPGLTGRSGG